MSVPHATNNENLEGQSSFLTLRYTYVALGKGRKKSR